VCYDLIQINSAAVILENYRFLIPFQNNSVERVFRYQMMGDNYFLTSFRVRNTAPGM
jgi:hypothetical protein